MTRGSFETLAENAKKKRKSIRKSSVVDYPFQLSNLVRGLEELLEFG